MAPKSKTAAAAAAAPSKITYKDMIKSAIVTLKERNGSSLSQQLSAIAVVRSLLTVFKGQFASHHTQNSISLCAILTISSRQALKKYVQSNNDTKTANFDALFNAALRKGVESGDFLQPKGPSGPVKLAKKEKPVVPKVTKKAPVKKEKPAAPKKAAPKKAAPKKVVKKTAAKKAAPKKAAPKKAAPKKAATKKAAPKKGSK
ncbi:hypothetical protein G9P44_003314 [Scheffersomyces stipitis]|nr:hypothetical protein G9P44_003314 [Scheffersomyces stipitis]